MSTLHVSDRSLFGTAKTNLRKNLKVIQYFHWINSLGFQHFKLFKGMEVAKRVTNCYTWMMNFARPVLITSQNEDYRLLLREMLVKNGFFQVWEASSESEARTFLRDAQKNIFHLLHEKQASTEFLSEISSSRGFIVLTGDHSERAEQWALRYGVDHFLSFPFSAKSLVEKMSSLS